MIRALTCAAALVIATSVYADNKFYRWSGPLPELVEKNLPADVPASDVLVQDGCFFYLYEGKAYQLTNAATGGLPICIG